MGEPNHAALLAKTFEWIRWLAATAQPPHEAGGTGDESDTHDGLYRVPVASYQQFGRAIGEIECQANARVGADRPAGHTTEGE